MRLLLTLPVIGMLIAACGPQPAQSNSSANAGARNAPMNKAAVPTPEIKLPDEPEKPAREWPLPTAEVDDSWPVLLVKPNPQSATLLDYSFNGSKPGHSSNAERAIKDYITGMVGGGRDRDYEKLNQLGAVFRCTPSLSAQAIEDGWGMLRWNFATAVIELPIDDGSALRLAHKRVFEATKPTVEPPPPEQPPENEAEFPKDDGEDSEYADTRCWVRAVVDRNTGTYGIALMHGMLRRNFSSTAFKGAELWADDKVNAAEYRRVRDALVKALLAEFKPGTNVHIDFQQANKPKGATRYIPGAAFFLMWDAVGIALREIDPEAKIVLGGW